MSAFDASEYHFELPPELIAQAPATDRDGSRLMALLPRGEMVHRRFSEIGEFLRPGDVLVLNRTKVMKARCFAQKSNGTRVETLILSIQGDPRAVPVLLRPGKRAKVGTLLQFPLSGERAEVVSKDRDGTAYLDFGGREALLSVIDRDGAVPLPPYIKRPEQPTEEDRERYQTVYARDLGAVAAPTAGLHFTSDLIDRLRAGNVQIAFVTHHVGAGTFKPLYASDIREHVMDEEVYHIEGETAAVLNQAKAEGRRIVAVGTTTTRCLESNFDGRFHAAAAATDLYIYPGYRFRAIDALVTNFHLPGSSLILLVSAFAGRERILSVYRLAVRMGYRFYSYGDAMLLSASV